MTVRLKACACALAATFAFGLLATLPTRAADPPTTPVPPVVRTNGEITAVSATSITIKPRKEDAKTFTINDATKVRIDGKPAGVGDLKAGQHARVNSELTTALEISVRTRAPKGRNQTPPTPADPAPEPATPAAP